MPLRLKRDVFKTEFRQKHFLSVGKHLFPINAFLDTQVRHNGPMTGCQRPDMQIMHAAYAGNATQCIPHVVIVDALGNSIEKNGRRILEHFISGVQNKRTYNKRQNRIGYRKLLPEEINQGTSQNRCHGTEQVAHHMQQRSSGIDVFLVTGKRPCHGNVDAHADKGNDHHRATVDLGRTVKTLYGFVKNPPHHA